MQFGSVNWIHWSLAALLLFSLSVITTHAVKILCIKKNILDIPNQRSAHHIPVPRGGGLSFVILFYAALTVLYFNHIILLSTLLSLLGGLAVATIGYVDDLFRVKARWRAFIHVLSAVWGLSFLELSPLEFLFAVFLVTWFINLYNFMDGIDGLAAVEAVFVSAAMSGILLLQGIFGIAFICFVLCFLLLGFLAHNWSPAKIFMGDVGSGFLGYVFGILMWTTNTQYHVSFLVWSILLSVFIIDSSNTLMRRMFKKEVWWLPHRDHLYQQFTRSGNTHQSITLAIFAINCLVCLPLALIAIKLQFVALVFYAFSLFIIFSICWYTMIRKLSRKKCLTGQTI